MINYKKKYLKYKQKYLMNQISGGSADVNAPKPVITVSEANKFDLTVTSGEPKEGSIITFNKDIYASKDDGINYTELLKEGHGYVVNSVTEKDGNIYKVEFKDVTVEENSRLYFGNEDLQVELRNNEGVSVEALIILADDKLKLKLKLEPDGVDPADLDFTNKEWTMTSSKNNIYKKNGNILFTRNQEYILSGGLENATFSKDDQAINIDGQKLYSYDEVNNTVGIEVSDISQTQVPVPSTADITVDKLNPDITEKDIFELTTVDNGEPQKGNIITFNKDIYASKNNDKNYKDLLKEGHRYVVNSFTDKGNNIYRVQLKDVTVEQGSKLYFRNEKLLVMIQGTGRYVQAQLSLEDSLFKFTNLPTEGYNKADDWTMTSKKKIFANDKLLFDSDKKYKFNGNSKKVEFYTLQQKPDDLSDVKLYSYDVIGDVASLAVQPVQVPSMDQGLTGKSPDVADDQGQQDQDDISFEKIQTKLINALTSAKSDKIPSLIEEIIPEIHNMVKKFKISQEVEISDKNVGIFGCNLGNKKPRIFVFRVDPPASIDAA